MQQVSNHAHIHLHILTLALPTKGAVAPEERTTVMTRWAALSTTKSSSLLGLCAIPDGAVALASCVCVCLCVYVCEYVCVCGVVYVSSRAYHSCLLVCVYLFIYACASIYVYLLHACIYICPTYRVLSMHSKSSAQLPPVVYMPSQWGRLSHHMYAYLVRCCVQVA
jgi:hypothetical protein